MPMGLSSNRTPSTTRRMILRCRCFGRLGRCASAPSSAPGLSVIVLVGGIRAVARLVLLPRLVLAHDRVDQLRQARPLFHRTVIVEVQLRDGVAAAAAAGLAAQEDACPPRALQVRGHRARPLLCGYESVGLLVVGCY